MPSNLPPGCTNRMIDEQAGVDLQCEVCGKFVDDCICPECPICGTFGLRECYTQHGLKLSVQQIESKAAADEAMKQAIEDENAYFDQLMSPEPGDKQCDVCSKMVKRTHRCWVAGTETFACDKCYGYDPQAYGEDP